MRQPPSPTAATAEDKRLEAGLAPAPRAPSPAAAPSENKTPGATAADKARPVAHLMPVPAADEIGPAASRVRTVEDPESAYTPPQES
jgi:hypothetical protein